MARQYAPLLTAIWQDRDFTALSGSAQRVFLLAVSQPNMSWCGVVPFTARRWASFAPDTTTKQVARDVAELEGAGLLLLDENTEELWVRSFIKHNVLAQPKLLHAAKREFEQIHSDLIRDGIRKAYGWATEPPSDAQTEAEATASSETAESCVLGVGVQCEEEQVKDTNTYTDTQREACRAEAERQAAAWAAKDPNAIVDRNRWVAKRTKTLLDSGWEPAQRLLRVVCPNPDCRDGHDLGGAVPVPCSVCSKAQAS